MNPLQFLKMHKTLKSEFGKQYETNFLNSSTDPTQDIPLDRVELIAGRPVNVNLQNLMFTNQGVDSLSTMDRRNNDKFDVVGELQAHERKFKSVKPIKNEEK